MDKILPLLIALVLWIWRDRDASIKRMQDDIMQARLDILQLKRDVVYLKEDK